MFTLILFFERKRLFRGLCDIMLGIFDVSDSSFYWGREFICGVGLLSLGILFSKLANTLSGGFQTPKKPRHFGTWAVVTGATDGIGKAICLELARKGMNILLISRTEEKLVQTEKEIEIATAGSVKTAHVAIDYSKFDIAAKDKVKKALIALPDVGILVNNVGQSYEFPQFFNELSTDDIEGMINLNIASTTWMTHIVLPIMLERKKGLIINIGSVAGVRPTPLLSLYSASKSFVEIFGRSLDAEYRSKGIMVQTHTPAFITTKLSKVRKSSLFVPTPTKYAQDVVNSLGKGGPMVSPYLPHRIMSFGMSLVPEFLTQSMTMKMLLSLRSKKLKKTQTSAKPDSDSDVSPLL